MDGDGSGDGSGDDGWDGATVGESEPASPLTLSTGQTVHLPLETEATVVGAVYAVPRARAASMLPDGLAPLRVTPTGRAAVTVLSVEYHDIGVEGIDPYDEFGIVVPATHGTPSAVPLVSTLRGGPSGYVSSLPVTTEPARALGVEVWGYPKVVAAIDHRDEGSTRKTTVSVDGECLLSLSVDRPRTRSVAVDAASYAVRDGTLLRIPAEIDAEAGAWPLTGGVSLALGDHERADTLRTLDLGGRALARIGIEGSVTYGAGEPVAGR